MSEDYMPRDVRPHHFQPFHYHGDEVRILFVITVALSLVAMPLWGNLLPFGTVFQVMGAIAFVILAGLTNPHSKVLVFLDAAASAIGVLLFEVMAINFYNIQPWQLFWAREIGALLLLFALYLSVRTLRAMMQGTVGHTDDLS